MENIPPVARNDNRVALPGVVTNHARRIRGDRAVLGPTWFRGHDWPGRFVNSANLARCVGSTGDTVWLIPDPSGHAQLWPWRLPRRTPESPGATVARATVADTVVEETERADGVHGLGAWALAVVMGAILATLIGAATVSRTSSSAAAVRKQVRPSRC